MGIRSIFMSEFFNQNSSNQGLDLTKEMFGIGKSNETNHSEARKYRKKIGREDVIEIADVVFENRKIAKHTYTVSRNVSFSAYNETNDDHTTDVTDDKIEIINYIIGDDKSIQSLLLNSNELNIEELCNSQFDDLDKNNTLFILNDNKEFDILRNTIEGLEYDLISYNFNCSFLEDELDEESIVQVFSKLYMDCRELQVSKEDVSEVYDKTLISIIDDDRNEYKFAYQNSITIFSAQTGNFKSTLLNQIAASIANSNRTLELECTNQEAEGVVVLIDTELNKADLAHRYLQNPNNIQYYSFKGLNNRAMIDMSRNILNMYTSEKKKIKALFLDSVIDFVEDFNNNIESTELINLLERITNEYHIPIFISYQENTQRSGNMGTKPSGHLGSKLIQKSGAYYRIKKNKDGVELEGIKNRYAKTFTLELEIKEDENSYAYLVSKGIKKPEASSSEKKEETFREAIEMIFDEHEIISNAQLELILMDLLEIKDRSAKTYKKKAETEGLIVVADKKGKVKYWKKG